MRCVLAAGAHSARRRRMVYFMGLFLEALAVRLPLGIRAEPALVADEHARGLLVALELPVEPRDGDVRKLAAARMEVRGRVAGVVARAVEDRHVVDRVEVRLR